MTPLMDAARANHIEAVQFLISEYEVCIAVRGMQWNASIKDTLNKGTSIMKTLSAVPTT